ncbi:MAG: hypothetical protein AAGF11_42760 [Myxococcota bacterium]
MRATILPSMRAEARATRWLGATTLGVILSCSGDAPQQPPSIPGPASSSTAADFAERWDAPTVEDLLAALAQPHAVVRTNLGPHQLQRSADFSLVPPGAPPGAPSAAPPNDDPGSDPRSAPGSDPDSALAPTDRSAPAPAPAPEVDRPVVRPQVVHDELELRWGTVDEGPVTLHLAQTNDHDRGREVIVIGETIHVRHAHRGWNHYPRDSDRIEQWLDDAQRSVHDVVELAAPRLSIQATRVDGAGIGGGAGVEITLGLTDAIRPETTARGPTQRWRTQAQIEAIEGTLRLDARRGVWLEADVNVRYRLMGADGSPLTGQAQVRGRVTPGAVAVQAPADSFPLRSRLRYDDERRRLLDGLAAP